MTRAIIWASLVGVLFLWDSGVVHSADKNGVEQATKFVKKTNKANLPAAEAVAPTSALTIHRPPTDVERSSLEEERAENLKILIERSQDFKEIVNSMVRHVYDMKLANIDRKYETRLAEEERLELKALKEATKYFEEFLKKYPNNLKYTPDAMFRLAELYYDVAYIEYLEQMDAYSESQDKGADENLDIPRKDFSKSIKLFEDIARRYPQYRNIDGVYYLLGYCLNEVAREEAARLAWLNLVCGNKYAYNPFPKNETNVQKENDSPARSLDTGVSSEEATKAIFVDPYAECEPVTENSRFFFESWWLIGNYHFDYDISKFGVDIAMSAYQKLIADPNHRFYDKGLYKLAWSYFKADRYPEAIQTFSQVVEFTDKSRKQGSGMRPESIQYLAVCFFTDDWDVDLVPDETNSVERVQDASLMPQDKKWTKEVYSRLGDILAENEKHDLAIEVWQLFIQKWPLDSQTPFVQGKIADSFRAQRLFDQELIARSKLDNYGKGSAWWNANGDLPNIQNDVATLAKEALINSAVTHHQNAQSLRAKANATQDTEIMEFALEEYKLAAKAYSKFIEQNPDTPDAYDLNFQMADALFWSGNYQEAKEEYKSVRDSNLDDRHRESAAHMVVLSVERIIENEIAEGHLVLREQPPELSGEPPVINPLPIPPLLVELMSEREAYLESNSGATQSSTFAYQSAQNYYRYGHWEEAKQRYEMIYAQYCKKDELSLVSWKTMLNMASETDDINEKERLALMETEKQCAVEGMDADGSDGIDLGSLLGDVAMQRAMKQFEACNEGKDAKVCTAAGEQLVAAVEKAPTHQSADAALHNAALAYEKANRFDSAMKIFGRIVDEYPQSNWVDKCLFKQAYAANKFFEYEKALDNYKILADDKRFVESEYREDSIYNTAYILTNLQSYKQAIPYWERFSNEIDDALKRIEAAYNAADMQFKAKSWANAIRAYDSFITKYKRNKDAGPFIVKASYFASVAEGKRRKRNSQVKVWPRTVSFYTQFVKDPGSMSAEYAAESHFLMIEEDMRKFEKFTIKGSQKEIDKKMKSGAEKVKEFETKYRMVQKYGRPVWSLAAEFRIGYAYEVFAKAILNIPPPPLDNELKKALRQLPPEDREMVMLEYEDKFRAAMESRVGAMENRAQEEYKIAIDMARKGNISNNWTLLALERMNAYDPEQYPRQHNGMIYIENRSIGAPRFASEVK